VIEKKKKKKKKKNWRRAKGFFLAQAHAVGPTHAGIAGMAIGASGLLEGRSDDWQRNITFFFFFFFEVAPPQKMAMHVTRVNKIKSSLGNI
jgi:hypothetical protein